MASKNAGRSSGMTVMSASRIIRTSPLAAARPARTAAPFPSPGPPTSLRRRCGIGGDRLRTRVGGGVVAPIVDEDDLREGAHLRHALRNREHVPFLVLARHDDGGRVVRRRPGQRHAGRATTKRTKPRRWRSGKRPTTSFISSATPGTYFGTACARRSSPPRSRRAGGGRGGRPATASSASGCRASGRSRAARPTSGSQRWL